MTPTKAKDGKSNSIDGETAVEEALASIGAAKLYKEITDANVDALRTRAEQMLWIAGGDRRARWRDIEEQAICNVRWPWLPAKGTRRIAAPGGQHGRMARQQGRLHREGPVPAGQDVREGRHPLARRRDRQGDHRPDADQRRRQGQNPLRADGRRLDGLARRARPHLRKRRDGPVVPRGRSRRQARNRRRREMDQHADHHP